MASAERWSRNTLRDRIDSMLYERTAISNQKSLAEAKQRLGEE